MQLFTRRVIESPRGLRIIRYRYDNNEALKSHISVDTRLLMHTYLPHMEILLRFIFLFLRVVKEGHSVRLKGNFSNRNITGELINTIEDRDVYYTSV